MSVDPDSIAKIAGPILSLVIGALLKRYTEARSRVISFLGNVSAFTLQGDPGGVVHTHSIVVRNAGRKAAHNVRLAHRILPDNVTIFPQIKHQIERNADQSGEIIFPVLVPKEQITVSYLYFPPVVWSQINSSTKSDDGFAKIIKVVPTPRPNKAVLAIVWLLMFVGASFILYWFVRLVLFVL